MKKVLNFVKGKSGERSKINPQISVEITNPSGQKITSDDEHIVGLQQGFGYNIDVNGKDKAMLKIHKAAWFGQLDKLKLHSKKCDVNTVDSMNRTCLHLAVAQGHTEVAWYLLNNNASITACDSEGLTPFLKAIECGHKDCTNLLIECGADVNTTDKCGNTGLHLAARSGFYNIASLLLKEGANSNVPNNDGEFPIHLATSSDHREIVELFLRCGASVDVQDRERRTPLMISARAGLTTIIKVLLDGGANCDVSDSNGWTAEDYAQFGGHQDLMEMLQTRKEEAGLDGSDKLSIHSSDQSEHVNFENPPINGNKLNRDESQQSPPSCVIPPALDPPRSWDLIQSGAIDQEKPDRKTTLTLGIKSINDVRDCNELMATPVEFAPATLSPSGDAVPSEMRLSPEPTSLVPTPERRTRSPLERAHSLDLPSDQDSPILGYSQEELNKHHTPSGNDNVPQDPPVSANENNNNYNLNAHFSPKNQMFPDDNFLTTFRELSKQTTADIDNCNLLKTNLRLTNDFDDNTYTMESSHSCDNLDGRSMDTDNYCTGVSSSLDNIDEIEVKSLSIEIIQSTGNLDDTLSVCTTSKTMFRETHSLELLDEDQTKQYKNKRHVRNKSITLTGQPQIWKSVEALPKQQESATERGSIDAQLLCYDKALEQLAEASIKAKNDAEMAHPPDNTSSDKAMVCHLGTPPDEFKIDLMDSLEGETSFPPPPVHFLHSDDSDVIEINFEDRNDQLDECLRIPISMLTPIKETQIECDSLSNADNFGSNDSSIHERLNLEGSTSHFNVKVIVNNKSPEMSQSLGESTPRCIQTPSNSYQIDRDVFLDDSTLAEHYGKYIVDVKALQLQPSSVDINKIEIPTDSPSPAESDDRSSSKLPSINFIIGGSCHVNAGGVAPETADLTDSYTDTEFIGFPVRRKSRRLLRGAGVGGGSGGGGSGSKETPDNQMLGDFNGDVVEVADDDDDEDSDEEDPPFWQNTDQGGFFMRQDTVVPAVVTFPKLISSTGKEDAAMMLPRMSSKASASRGNSDGSSDAETVSASDTPRQFSKGSLHAHLREATFEKGKLEETAANLLDKAERLKYELEDSRQAEAARDDAITVLQNQLTRLECRYARAQEELCTQRQRASSAENELQHLRELCANLSKDKAEMYRELSKQLNHPSSKPDFQQSDEFSQKHLHLMIKHLEDSKKLEEEKNQRLVHHLEEVLLTNQNMISEREALIAQNIADVRKLQEDTICWKDRYEELAAKLEMMDKKQDPRLIEAQDTIATLKRTIALLQQEKCFPKQHDATTSTASPKATAFPAPSVKPTSTSTRTNAFEAALIELTAIKLELDGSLTSDFKKAVLASLPKGCAEEDKIESLLDSESDKTREIARKVNCLLREFQASNSVHADYENMRNIFELEFMSKKDFENLKAFHEETLNRLKKEVFSESYLELTEKLAHITELLQRQIQEQARIERARTNSEISLRQKFDHISNTIQSELTEIQATLKESEEQILKKRLEQVTREVGNIKGKSSHSRDKYEEAFKSSALSEKLNDLPQEYISRSVTSDNSQSIEERFTEDLKEKYSLSK